MEQNLEATIKAVCQECGNDRNRMMDIVRGVQEKLGHVSGEAMEMIAKEVDTHRVEVESVVSFYAFLSDKPKGKMIIRLCNDIIDQMKGYEQVEKAVEAELGVQVGHTTADGMFSLEHTPCIGMCDQAPAAMVNDVIVTNLTADKAKAMISSLKQHGDPQKLITDMGDGNNAHELVKAMVVNNIKEKGTVVLSDMEPGTALKKTITMTPADVIKEVKESRLRGRGGAGFPTGMKWDFTSGAEGNKKYVVCNADEGEPGTFKDRVILTEQANKLFEGMAIAGYAIGSDEGIVYLRGEYAYLRPYLEKVLDERRSNNLLGNNILGKDGFNFDIRIQMGAGAYVCGEETALLSSCEGQRGDPKNRPPFPAQKGYLGCPTTVNNVETFCCVSYILANGAASFAGVGSKGSSGTKLLSISGDCKEPGVYEVPFGTSINAMLGKVGAENTAAVQIGGPSGQLIAPADFDKVICYDHVATGGSFMVFNEDRDLLGVVKAFMEFFNEESCGYCTPCRVGNVLIQERLERIMSGKGEKSDIPYLEQLCETVKATSRCGLGQTSPNPVATSLKNFRSLYESKVKDNDQGLNLNFDLQAAVQTSEELAGRKSVHFE